MVGLGITLQAVGCVSRLFSRVGQPARSLLTVLAGLLLTVWAGGLCC